MSVVKSPAKMQCLSNYHCLSPKPLRDGLLRTMRKYAVDSAFLRGDSAVYLLPSRWITPSSVNPESSTHQTRIQRVLPEPQSSSSIPELD